AVRLVPDLPGEYRVELRVHDGKLWGAPARVAVRVAPPGSKIAADRGPREERFVDRRLEDRRLRRIRRLSFDLLWRGPSVEELTRWYEASHEEVVDGLLAAEEAWSAWYESQLYYFLLLDQFRPKEGPIPELPARLLRGEATPLRALEEIVRSQYFSARNPGNDTFVTVVLEQCLGMTVQEPRNKPLLEAGKKMYDGYAAKLFDEKGSSQADFVRIVFRRKEFYEHLLRRSYRDLHGTEIERKRLEGDRDRLAADPAAFRALLREWLCAPEYLERAAAARTKPEIPYVRALFLDTLGRLPSYEELRNVRNAFLSMADPTPVRLVMGRVLMDTGAAALSGAALDPPRFVREQFVRLLARVPTPEEEAAFAGALRDDPHVTPRIVVWTLLSSAEYQTY
ncbi:MAG: hypothetical protein ACREID_01395, partial [Planctomycetota bacterium]